MRTEKDFLGELQIEKNVLYGIHSKRAMLNFPDKTPFHIEWYKAIGLTKLACYNTYKNFKTAVTQKTTKSPIIFFDDNIITALQKSAQEIADGSYFNHFIIPAIQGGAGTSINMNVNEIISNSALLKLNKNPGEYNIIDPIMHANIYQSTNDVIPTSLKIAVIQLLSELEESINKLRFSTEELEKNNRNNLRIGYTQMQEAVPTTFGKLFSTYSDALSRDWWRVSKCFERIKVVNLGGSAIGTGITVPRYFIMEVISELQQLTKLPITKSENLSDTTANYDSFVEIHATLKSYAVNLEKMANDLRLLASDLSNNIISIPQKQTGSSIMPGKVNPVIPEFAISISHKIYANDVLVSSLCAQGCLELNAYLPVIGHALLESIKLLIAAGNSLQENLFTGLNINKTLAKEKLFKSPAITTALIPYIGYNKAAVLAKEMKNTKSTISEANKKLQFIENEELDKILEIQNLIKAGFSINDLL
ncbi:MAG: aspartate ammonia-lyase [Chlorobi bacterium]|nr:aspartate ammonia-lyase [Chlorobiota bacterium]